MLMNEPHPAATLLAIRRGDEAAARALWNMHAPGLVAYARAVLRRRENGQDADDIVQSAFCRIMRVDERELLAVRDPGAWLARITRNTAINWLRTHRRDLARRGRAGPEPRSAPSPTTDPAVADAVDALPPRLREVIVLRHIAGLTFDQIELATGVNRSTAASRYRAALTLLRESLELSGPNCPPAAGSARPHLVHHD